MFFEIRSSNKNCLFVCFCVHYSLLGWLAVCLTVVHHAVSLLVSAAFTDGTVRSSLLQQSNFKPWLQQLVLLAKEVMRVVQFFTCLSSLIPPLMLTLEDSNQKGFAISTVFCWLYNY